MPNINPATGLCTDYLNHFAEAMMAIEMAGEMPECLDHLRRWRPMTYRQHFEASRFSNREAVIRAYQASDPELRTALESASATLNALLIATRDAVLHCHAANAEPLTRRALKDIRPLIARTAALINGGASGCRRVNTQAEIDAMFSR
jgi:hypothetical protein